jgi:cysteine synthase
VDGAGGIAGIGNTPVVRLASQDSTSSAEIWVKLEAANPTGSYKDRMALAMIEAAEADGRLRPGQLVVEYTGGSTGSSLALVCAVKGYPLRIVSSDAFAAEKTATMRALGAEVELIPSPQGITPDLIPAMMKRAAEIAAQTGGFATDQFNNTDMVDGYRKLGEEVLEQLPGDPPVSAFCAYVGTAGCFLGVSQALSAGLPALHRVVVEPAESAVLSGGPPGIHHIEGGGIGRRCCTRTTTTRSSRSPTPTRSPRPAAPPATTASSPARPPARTCSPRPSWPGVSVPVTGSSPSRSTAG